MADHCKKYYDPYEEMHAFYRLDDPTEEEQFRFVEAMKYLVEKAYDPVEKQMSSFNLAMYFRDIKEFQLEKKYLEISLEAGDPFSREQLGFIWYYGLCGEQSFEKAFQCFKECGFERSQYMMADMYHYGQYVQPDIPKCREIIEKLFIRLEPERKDPRFVISTLFPEVALRLVLLDLEEGTDGRFDLDCLLDAREILTLCQRSRPFWGNIKTMQKILNTTAEMVGTEHDFIDLYDLLTFIHPEAMVTFDYNGKEYRLDIFSEANETIYQYDNKWYHGAVDFLEKARIDHKRITTVFDLISNIRITGEKQ